LFPLFFGNNFGESHLANSESLDPCWVSIDNNFKHLSLSWVVLVSREAIPKQRRTFGVSSPHSGRGNALPPKVLESSPTSSSKKRRVGKKNCPTPGSEHMFQNDKKMTFQNMRLA